MFEVEGEILAALDDAWAEHASVCEEEPYALLLNPGNYELLGWDEVDGLWVLPDDRVAPLRCLFVCGPTGGWGGWYEGERVWWFEGQPFVAVAEGEVG